MNEQPTTTSTTAGTWAPIVRFVGAAITILALVGTVVVFTDLNSAGFDEVEASTAEVWLGVLTGLTAVGVGVVVFALGLLLEHLAERP